ncbi:hypothetical protein SAMN05519103_09110 [Rhizobiales bacterium GAS113]|nr:hypothetical protein SAMN05519103_09110 [Rhizobiales bacterium GAS113]
MADPAETRMTGGAPATGIKRHHKLWPALT